MGKKASEFPVRRLRSLARHYIGDQLWRGRVRLVQEHHGVLHHRMLSQGRFNLPEFDANAVPLDLMIKPSQIEQCAIRLIAYQLPGLIEACSWCVTERIGEEPCCSECRLPPVTMREAGPADIEFSREPQRDWLHMGIQHIHLGIRNRPSNGHARQPHP